MYEKFFSLAGRPFVAAPQPELYFPGAAIEEARLNLSRSIQRAEGPGLVIGPAGSGKSLLCLVLATQFRERFDVASLNSARLCTRRALLQALLYELGLPYRDLEEGELRLSLIDHLTTTGSAKEGLLLLVDEAHALPLRLLEEIRMITNLVRNGQACVRLVLSGAMALEERFASPKLESFNQRIASRCYLQPLDREETGQYVRAQMAACGDESGSVFSPDAIEAVYRASGGIPRLVNQIADHALVLASQAGVQQIDTSEIETAWSDLQQLPIPWSSDLPSTNAACDSDSSVVEFGALDDLSDESVSVSQELTEPVLETSAADEPLPSVLFPGADSTSLLEEDDIPLDEALVEELLDSGSEEFRPVGVIGPQIETDMVLNSNPFDEDFDEEVVVLDRATMGNDSILRDSPQVQELSADRMGDELAAPEPLPATSSVTTVAPLQPLVFSSPIGNADPVMPEEPVIKSPEAMTEELLADVAAAQLPRPQSLHAASAPLAAVELSDDDLIVVEDDPVATRTRRPLVRRQEYGQLFSSLRQG